MKVLRKNNVLSVRQTLASERSAEHCSARTKVGPSGAMLRAPSSRHSTLVTRRSLRAFTLIEIMVAIAIFMMVLAAIYSTWALVTRATIVGQSAAAQAQRERVALRTIEDSLMCCQSFQASQQYYSFILLNGNAPMFSFAARLPEVFPRNGKFGDFNLRRVTFSLENDTEFTGEKNLVLRQNPILMDMDEDEQKSPLILARNVRKFGVECWDTNQFEWVTEWENTNAIPPMIRVELVMGGNPEAGASAPDISIIRAFSMPSSMMPAVVQHGTANGQGRGPGPKLPGQR